MGFTTEPSVGNALWIGDDEIFILSADLTRGATASVDTNDSFHNYRIEVDSAGAIEVFYDDVLTLTGTTFTDTTTNGLVKRILWGEGSILAHGDSEWEFVKHNAGTHECTPIFLPLIVRE